MSEKEATKAVQTVETIVFKRANDYFHQESIDSEWAPAHTTKLQTLLMEHAALSRVSIKTIECRSTQCQIIAYTPKSADADFFSAALYDALYGNKQKNKSGVTAIARQMENGLTSAYIARKGFSLDFFRNDHL